VLMGPPTTGTAEDNSEELLEIGLFKKGWLRGPSTRWFRMLIASRRKSPSCSHIRMTAVKTEATRDGCQSPQ
jgi:hypothetical protein